MLNYQIHGTNNNDTVILLHGLAQTHKAFDEQLELADNYRLIIPELRGHGDSPSDGYITLEQMAIDVLNLMDHLYIEQATLLCVSLGTLVAQEIYKLDSSRVKALILSNGYSYVPQVFLEAEIANRKRKLESVDDDEYIDGVAKACSLSQDIKIINKIKNTMKLNRNTYMACASASLGKDYLSVIRDMDIQVLICSGWFDVVTPIFLQIQQSILIHKAKHKQFMSGHLPNIECAREFNQVVREFMKEVD